MKHTAQTGSEPKLKNSEIFEFMSSGLMGGDPQIRFCKNVTTQSSRIYRMKSN